MQLGGERILKIGSHLPKLWYFISRDNTFKLQQFIVDDAKISGVFESPTFKK